MAQDAAADGGGDSHDAGSDAASDAAPPDARSDDTSEADASEADASSEAGSDAGPVIHCAPAAAQARYDVLEGDSVSFTLACSTGLAIDASELSFDSLPLGASYDDATATFSWTPTLDQAAVYPLTVRAGPWGETGVVTIAVVDRWDDPSNVPVVDPTTYTEEYGLPVIHLTPDPNIDGNAYTPATLVYRGHTFVGAQAKTRGAFSSTYPKKSYTLKLTKEDKWSDAQVAGGFLKKRKVTLITSFDDNSYVRQRLAYELWNALDAAHVQVQTYSAVLYLNGEYYGLYTVADHVDGYLMEDHGLRQDGDLFKARNHDANFRSTENDGDPKANLHAGYTKEEGMPLDGQPGAYDSLDALVSWVVNASDDDFRDQLGAHLVQREYEDWWLFVSFIMADDSAGKNSYHYFDPLDASARFHVIPWDMNHSFGQDWRTLRVGPQTTAPEAYYLGMNRLFERILAEATFATPLRTRYDTTLHAAYALDGVLARVDAMAAEIDPSARRDEAKWQSTYQGFGAWSSRTDFTTFDGELAYLRAWLTDRHAYLDSLY